MRKALAQLQSQGAIEAKHRLGRRIVNIAAAAPRNPGGSIGLITPEPLELLRPHTALWIDELRVLLFENHLQLTTFSGRRFFTKRPDKMLAGLVRQNPQACWVLTHSHQAMQRWFRHQGVPCVVAGSCHPRQPLPNIDLDFFSVCRHAAGSMLRLGHRRIGFLTQQSERAGDLESEAGFADGLQCSGHPDVRPTIAHHDGTVPGALRRLEAMLSRPARPTAILVAKPHFYLTTVAYLAQHGLRVPQDVSLICRDSDTFLRYLTPSVASYSFSSKLYARRLFSLTLALTRQETLANPVQRIESKFNRGASLAPVNLG